jgi:ornithine carbamoyltransferase
MEEGYSSMRHVLSMFDLSPEEIQKLFVEAAYLKAAHQRHIPTPILPGRVLALVFEKPSLRTRVSFQAGISQLGASSFFLSGSDVGLGSRESVPDVARTISQYLDGVIMRTYSHLTIDGFAANSTCPVINGLSDRYHPCQAMADIFTLHELCGDVQGRTLAFVGDGNNVARCLAVACGKLGVQFILAAPKEYQLDKPFLKLYQKEISREPIQQTDDPREAVRHADVIYTDVWTSMGQEAENEQRRKRFAAFQVNDGLFQHAPDHAWFMHCLPARRGEEVTGDVLDGPRSVVFQQAGNRMHVQKALIKWLLV